MEDNILQCNEKDDLYSMLKYLQENDIVDISQVRNAIEMKKREELLKQHKRKITQGSDGKWRTYVEDETKKSGLRMIKKATRKNLDDELVAYYKKQGSKKPTFEQIYRKWRAVQDHLVGDNTVYKYNTDYKRFFEGSNLIKREIEKISEDDLKVFFYDCIKNNKLTKGAFKKLFGYVNNTFGKAYREKVIYENPMNQLVCKQFYGYCEEVIKPLSKKIYSDEEAEMILQKLHKEYEDKPSYIPNYAVEFASLTGMRVGEIVALKWEDFNYEKGYFTINKSEKYNRVSKEYYIDLTKNKKERQFPIDDVLRNLLAKIKKSELSAGYLCEWVFANEDGRIHAPVISSCIKNKCRQLGIPERGIHAFRRTLNSNMRCAGVSEMITSSLLGHSPQVNRQYYTFDVTTLSDKAEVIEKMHKNRKNA